MTIATETHDCACSAYFAEIEGEEDWTTGCNAKTLRTFAPGHDAKLKGLLIRVGSTGASIAYSQGGLRVDSDAETIAKEYGFETQVIAGIARERARAEAKHAKKLAREASKLERAAKKAKTNGKEADRAFADALAEVKVTSREKYPERTTAKIGRWEYQGVVRDGVFHYTDKSNTAKSAKKFTIIVEK